MVYCVYVWRVFLQVKDIIRNIIYIIITDFIYMIAVRCALYAVRKTLLTNAHYELRTNFDSHLDQ